MASACPPTPLPPPPTSSRSRSSECLVNSSNPSPLHRPSFLPPPHPILCPPMLPSRPVQSAPATCMPPNQPNQAVPVHCFQQAPTARSNNSCSVCAVRALLSCFTRATSSPPIPFLSSPLLAGRTSFCNRTESAAACQVFSPYVSPIRRISWHPCTEPSNASAQQNSACLTSAPQCAGSPPPAPC